MDTTCGMDTDSSSRRSVLATIAGATTVGLAGCIGGNSGDEEFVFAIEAQDDPADVERDWEPLAEWIESETDVSTGIDTVSDSSAAIGALASGQADASYLSGGPSWVGWNEYEFETIAVEADEDGRPFYIAAGYTRSDTGIETIRDAEGVDSAHTGDLTGAGMLIPTAYLADEGLVSFEDDDDVTAIRGAVEEYFGNPVVGGGYIGALQALSEEQADIAFGRATTPEEYCGGDDVEEWCLDLDEYVIVEEFTEVPSHPVLASTETSESERELLEEAFLALNDDPEGQEILDDIFDVYELQAATSEEHLGPYGELISNLPGIEDHLTEEG
ncbi:phosphate/phosphite/phosphonate ABC transporter substrate-binding protein [Halorubrum vacuolatum]|uniref:ABC-type phosphate/phosphonate transport system, substrate-binding protein n=1 Tax=Halorubrum vacuolatum TaxID=63740 RepID=A0A238VZ66_HALVU|nr:PhnD/SsuA/transferrin family substrate-binding protein [Halorubrum vacuolatum]SNR39528.1 ABC-type phosphate/phosphonate transport system, substrate-binding protein [Halorubrum vacuolatum]